MRHTIMFFDPNGMRSVECASREEQDRRVAAEVNSGRWEVGTVSENDRQRVVPLSPVRRSA